MPRPARQCPGGQLFHVLNRANSRNQIFSDHFDYCAFIETLLEGLSSFSVQIHAYCLMPNHWHMILQPSLDGELSTFMGWLTNAHTRRYRVRNQSWGQGSLYQGRFKSFPIKNDQHFVTVKRYVERNPVRANIVPCASQWPWSSLGQYRHNKSKVPVSTALFDPPSNWLELVNATQSEAEEAALRKSILRGTPYGDPDWISTTIEALGLQASINPIGRPPSLKMHVPAIKDQPY